MSAARKRDPEAELTAAVGEYAYNPLGFVRCMYPWGKAGTTLSDQDGPDTWQAEVLMALGSRLKAGVNARDAMSTAVKVAVASGHGIGKALGHGEPVLTPNGWRPIESLQVGDFVMAGDGTPTMVRGVYPQGERELYRVTLDDGCSLVVDGDHLWFTTTRSERKHDKHGQVRTTRQIADSLTFPNGPRDGWNHQIPTAGAVQHSTISLPMEPYLFGCWLGDGDAKGRITGEEPQFEELCAAGAELGVVGRDTRRSNVITRSALGVRPALRALNLYGCRAHEKRIPALYLHADIQQRTALLQGLLDTDGTANKQGAIIFETTAPGLAEGVAELVRSLGGVVRRSGKQGAYGGKECRWVYRLYLSLPRGIQPFRLPHKAERYGPAWGDRNCDRTRRRFIVAVEPAGRGAATCIAVDHHSRLFITRDHIVTHNTALVAWIIHWFVSCFDFSQTVVTANTKTQLLTKTWRELAKWHRMALNKHWFQWTATQFKHTSYPDTWFASAIPWSEHNSEAFAGTHEKFVLMVYDEASNVHDAIWEVTEGAMTTAGAVWIAFGNPTRNTGRFAECFGRQKHRWITFQIDSRTAKMANKAQIQQWVDDYGEDSDFVRVRVRGVFPRAGSLQLISSEAVLHAMQRQLRYEDQDHAAKVMGIDVARHGDDQSCSIRRRGQWTSPAKRFRIPDLMLLASVFAEEINEYEPDAAFIDVTGMGWGVYDRLRQLCDPQILFPVQVGEAALEPKRFFNRRAEIWWRMRDWIIEGGMLVNDPEMEADLIGPEYGFAERERVQLEKKEDMKARGLASPDGGDSLALTFTTTVVPKEPPKQTWRDRLIRRPGQRSAQAA